MKTKIISVTVGISVYNESKNIQHLLKSIQAQTAKSFRLDKIIVVCDGSTDGTDRLVLELAEKQKLIHLIDRRDRVGKKKRLMEIYEQNKSDFLIILDGDIGLANPGILGKLVGEYIKTKAAIVGGNPQPFKPVNFVQKLMNTWEDIWFKTKVNEYGRNNIHHISGCVMGLSGSFAKSIVLPTDMISEAQYIYCLAKEKGLSFVFTKEAVVYYRKPASINDYFIQVNRYGAEKYKMAKRFGYQVNEEYAIPLKNKISAVLVNMLKDPIFTFLTLFLIFILPHRKQKQDKGRSRNLWNIVPSTKEGINI